MLSKAISRWFARSLKMFALRCVRYVEPLQSARQDSESLQTEFAKVLAIEGNLFKDLLSGAASS
jgi:hypothetical protein